VYCETLIDGNCVVRHRQVTLRNSENWVVERFSCPQNGVDNMTIEG